MSKDDDENKGDLYNEIQKEAEKKQKKKKKTDPRSKAATENKNLENRQTKAGDVGHQTRIANRKKRGAPRKVGDMAVIETFMRWKRRGVNNRIACGYAGISTDSVNNWLKRATKAIDECQQNDMNEDEHEDFDYIQFKDAYDFTNEEIVFEDLACLNSQKFDIFKYEKDDEGNYVYDNQGNLIPEKLIKPANLEAIKMSLRIADPENFDDKKSNVDININNKENRNVVFISMASNAEFDENGELIEGETVNSKEHFLEEMSQQQSSLTNYLDEQLKEDIKYENKPNNEDKK